MKSVIKMPHLETRSPASTLFRSTLLATLIASLTACASYRDIAPNSPVSEATQIMGQPTHVCSRDDGGQRLVWSTQPMGQYVYGANVGSSGNLIGSVYSVLTDKNFRKLDSDNWSAHDVLCEFGPPAETEVLGLGEKREQIWSYRYKQNNHWNQLLHIYMGRDGQQATRWHTGPDPLYEREYFFNGF